MSLLVRLLTLLVTTVILRGTLSTVIITAPSTVTDETGGLETRVEGPTTWICSTLLVDSSWTAYANIRGYLEGGNAEGKDYTNLVLYPVMELFHATESRLCVYLPAVDHCYPPAPSNSQVKIVKQLYNKNYYDIRYWGQTSDTRVEYYKQKLMAALNAQTKAAKFDVLFVSYFGDHVREVRYDPAPMTRTRIRPTVQGSISCGAVADYQITGTIMEIEGEEFVLTSLPKFRLGLFDVETSQLAGADGESKDSCSMAAANEGINAFSFVNNTCNLYKFQEDFCPCEPGDFEIYINKNRFGETKELTGGVSVLSGLKKMVIYTEAPMTTGYALELFAPLHRSNKRRCQSVLRAKPTQKGALSVENICFTTEKQDIPNCDQTCRGQPLNAIVKKENQYKNPPFLSLCGQRVSVRKMMRGSRPVKMAYFSHDGIGCYRYPEATTTEEQDCTVDFQMPTQRTRINITPISVNRDPNGTCHDVLNIHNVLPDTISLCSGTQSLRKVGRTFRINFHRKLGSGVGEFNIGFVLEFLIR